MDPYNTHIRLTEQQSQINALQDEVAKLGEIAPSVVITHLKRQLEKQDELIAGLQYQLERFERESEARFKELGRIPAAKRLIEYAVFIELTGNALAKQVNKLISEGWRPLGGVSMMSHQDRHVFAQAMIKDKPPETI